MNAMELFKSSMRARLCPSYIPVLIDEPIGTDEFVIQIAVVYGLFFTIIGVVLSSIFSESTVYVKDTKTQTDDCDISDDYNRLIAAQILEDLKRYETSEDDESDDESDCGSYDSIYF